MAKSKTNTKGEPAQKRPAQEPGKAGVEQPVSAPATNTPPAPEAETGGAPKDASPADAVVVVAGPKKGRWRAGRHFGAEPVSIPLADLSDADMQALNADPALSVTIVPGEAE